MEWYAHLVQWKIWLSIWKEFLKHCFKKLLKYYTDVNSLLEFKGFSWDEIQQKISADDYVWDNYIKVHYHIYLVTGIHFYCISCIQLLMEAHPDAHSYRRKTLLSYCDLKLIFGNAVRNGHCSHLLQGRNFEDDIIQIKMGVVHFLN